MSGKWIGAVLIVTACGGAGFSAAANVRKEKIMIQQLLSAMEYMKAQLQYQLTPLPQLCRMTAKGASGAIRKLFDTLAGELEQQILPEAPDCMRAALLSVTELPESIRSICHDLGNTLGQLDLNGQVQGLEHAMEACRRKEVQLEHNHEQRLRSYQTLSLCAGVALAILLM